MADRVLAVVDGKLAAAGDVPSIRQAMSDIPYRVRVETDDPRAIASPLMSVDHVSSVEVDGQMLHVETHDLAELGRTIPQISQDTGSRVLAFEPEDESLESVFRYLVRRT
jgi:ABC-2 type transport system ATP-binding protein